MACVRPRFTLDEQVLPRGVALHSSLAMRYLKQFKKKKAATNTEL